MSISQSVAAPRLSIVVLPFGNLGSDPDQQYFADGITEDLTTDLSRLADMLVISRNTAFTYRNKQVDTKQIGRELGVRYVLEGSVRRSSNRVRINAQLIDAETDAHLWAERFDRDASDLFALQDEITSRIAVALNIELVAAEAARPTVRPDALDCILRGRAALLKPLARDNCAAAITQFEHALVLDPESVEAKSLLANWLASRVLDDLGDSPAADLARADTLVRQALAASTRSYLPHLARAQLLRAQGRFDEAIPEYEIVIAANRNLVGALANLGRCEFLIGSMEKMISRHEQAIRLSPRDPAIDIFYLRIGYGHLLESRTDEAIRWLERSRNANPESARTHAYLASAHALKGDTKRATAELTEARRLTRDDRYSCIASLRAAGLGGGSNYWGVPKVRALFETTFFAGLRTAGIPEV